MKENEEPNPKCHDCNGPTHRVAQGFACHHCNHVIVETQPAHEKKIAYIAGALNALSIEYLQNVRRMILWSNKIRALGFAVFVPGIDLLHGIATDDWDYNAAFDNSQPFLAKSDIVFVCPGWENSKGTAREIELAESLGVPIYYGDDGYWDLQSRFIENLGTTMTDNIAQKLRGEMVESARDRRRPKDDYTISNELNDEALAELEKRIDDSPFRKTGDKFAVNKCCDTCTFYEKLNALDSGKSNGICNEGLLTLSAARFCEKPHTQSDYGKACPVWSTKYRC